MIDDQTGYWSTANDCIEWCVVDISTAGIDPDDEEDVVKAEDLEPYIPRSTPIRE